MTRGQLYALGGSALVVVGGTVAWLVLRAPRLRPGLHVVEIGDAVLLQPRAPFDPMKVQTGWLEPVRKSEAIAMAPAPVRNLFTEPQADDRFLRAIMLRPGIAQLAIKGPSGEVERWLLLTPKTDASSIVGTWPYVD